MEDENNMTTGNTGNPFSQSSYRNGNQNTYQNDSQNTNQGIYQSDNQSAYKNTEYQGCNQYDTQGGEYQGYNQYGSQGYNLNGENQGYNQGYSNYPNNNGYQQYGPGLNPKPKKNRTGLIAVIIVLAVLLVGIITFWVVVARMTGNKVISIGTDEETNTPQEVVEEYADAFCDMDTEGIMETFIPNATNTDDLESTFSDFFDTAAEYDAVFDENGNTFDIGDEYSDEELDEYLDGIEGSSLAKLGIDSACDVAYSVECELERDGVLYACEVTQHLTIVRSSGTWYLLTVTVDDLNPVEVKEKEVTTEDTSENTSDETSEDTSESISEEEVSSEASSEASIDTGYDWENMPFIFNGVEYNLATLTYADIEAMGYSLSEENEAEELEANYYTLSGTANSTTDESDITVRFKNFVSGETKVVTDCEILSVEFDNYLGNDYSIALPNGITLGMSYEEVKAVMGDDAYYDGYSGESGSLEYQKDNDEFYTSKVSFYFSDGALRSIELDDWSY